MVQSPRPISTIWKNFGGLCEVAGMGDPIVLYDRTAKNWVISQFAFFLDSNGDPAGQTDECVAISTSDDATGSYHRFEFFMNFGTFPDYPKLGVWRDGYYMSVVEFESGRITPNPRPLVLAQQDAQRPAGRDVRMARQNNASPLLPGDQETVAQAAPANPTSIPAYAPSPRLCASTCSSSTWTGPRRATPPLAGGTVLMPCPF